MNELAHVLAPSAGVHYEAGLRRSNTKPGNFPYVLIQARSANIRTYSEVDRALARDLSGSIKEAQGALRDLAANLSVGGAALDRASNRIVFRAQIDVRGVGTAQALSVGHIGSESVVFMHCYATQQDFSNWLPTFELLNDSFQYDEDHRFVAKDGQASIFSSLGDSVNPNDWTLGALCGGAGGAITGLIIVLVRRNSRTTEQSDSVPAGTAETAAERTAIAP